MTLQTKADLRQKKENFKKKTESVKAGFRKAVNKWNKMKQNRQQKLDAMTPQQKADIEKRKEVLWQLVQILAVIICIPFIAFIVFFFGAIDYGNGKDYSKYTHGKPRRRRH